MPTYITAPAPDIFVSDSSLKAERKIGFDPTDKNNVAYTLYNKKFDIYRGLGGFNVKPKTSTPPQTGDILTIYIDNITTSLPINSKTYTYTYTQYSAPTVVMIGMLDQKTLDVGDLEVYGNLFRPSANVIEVFKSAWIEQVKP